MSALLQIYRLGILVAIAWLIREHQLRLSIQGDRPVTVTEVAAFLPEAHRLVPDAGSRAGLNVIDRTGQSIGYAARTMPQSRKITGYSGPLDALIVLDAADKVVGVTIRHSYDTPSHVEDVSKDLLFMETWNGRTWEDIAAIEDLNAAGIYAVSGATRTSECLAQSIGQRLRAGAGASSPATTPFRWQWRDSLLVTLVGLGIVFAFWKSPRLQRWRG
ncbi:MAG: FMN-binding protein, partial [Verrucomicrobiae bacterium]|nr:FMN-binding protein [Verrucomicrobiae bacterium]